MKSLAQSVLENAVTTKMGWLTKEEVEILSKDSELRLQPCLVRMEGCRFVCGAQYVKYMIEKMESAGDYTRDVCIPAGDPIWKKLNIR
jgi:hypothetical protein